MLYGNNYDFERGEDRPTHYSYDKSTPKGSKPIHTGVPRKLTEARRKALEEEREMMISVVLCS